MPGHEIASVLTCKLCSEKIAGPGLVIGPGQASGRVAKFMESLTTHLASKHAQEFEALQQQALEFFGLNCVMQYVTQDDRVKYQRDWLRWKIHQVTLNARYTDEALQNLAAQFSGIIYSELTPLIVDAVYASGVFPSENVPKVFERAGENSRALIGAKLLEIVTIIRNELQEPTEPKAPAGFSVIKTG